MVPCFISPPFFSFLSLDINHNDSLGLAPLWVYFFSRWLPNLFPLSLSSLTSHLLRMSRGWESHERHKEVLRKTTARLCVTNPDFLGLLSPIILLMSFMSVPSSPSSAHCSVPVSVICTIEVLLYRHFLYGKSALCLSQEMTALCKGLLSQTGFPIICPFWKLEKVFFSEIEVGVSIIGRFWSSWRTIWNTKHCMLKRQVKRPFIL